MGQQHRVPGACSRQATPRDSSPNGVGVREAGAQGGPKEKRRGSARSRPRQTPSGQGSALLGCCDQHQAPGSRKRTPSPGGQRAETKMGRWAPPEAVACRPVLTGLRPRPRRVDTSSPRHRQGLSVSSRPPLRRTPARLGWGPPGTASQLDYLHKGPSPSSAQSELLVGLLLKTASAMFLPLF